MSELERFAAHLATQGEKLLGIRVQASSIEKVLALHKNPGPELERGCEDLKHGFTWDVNTMFILLAKISELEQRLDDRVDCVRSN